MYTYIHVRAHTTICMGVLHMYECVMYTFALYIYTCARTHDHMYGCVTYVLVCYVHIRIRSRTHTTVCMGVFFGMYTGVCVCVYVYVYVYVCTCTCVCVCVYMCMQNVKLLMMAGADVNAKV